MRLGASSPTCFWNNRRVGELITPIDLPAAEFLVLKPSAGLSTQAIFNSPLLKRDSETATIVGFAADTYRLNSIFEFGRNDLQPVALDLCPQLGQSLDWLAARKLQGRMTGSGSAVFAHLTHGTEISRFDSESNCGWKIRKCCNLEEHPLAGW